MMGFKDAVAEFGEEEVDRDLRVWWTVKSPEQKYRIMTAYLIINEEVNTSGQADDTEKSGSGKTS